MKKRKYGWLWMILGVSIVCTAVTFSAMAIEKSREEPSDLHKKIQQVGPADERTLQVRIQAERDPNTGTSGEFLVEDVVPKQFYLLQEGEQQPVVTGVVTDGEKPMKNQILEEGGAVFAVKGNAWEEKRISWSIPPDVNRYDRYDVTYYIRANEDYIGGEALRMPGDMSGEPIYIPWQFETQNGQVEIFYGDRVTFRNEDIYAEEPYEVAGSNETENANAFYHVKTDYKDKDGQGIVTDVVMERESSDGTCEMILSRENCKLYEWEDWIETEPESDGKYIFRFRKEKRVSYGRGGVWNPVYAGTDKKDEKYKRKFGDFLEKEVFVDVRVTSGKISVVKVLDWENYGAGFPLEIRGERIFLSPVMRPETMFTIGGLKRGVYHIKETPLQTFSFVGFENVTDGVKTKKNDLWIEVGFEDEEKHIYEEQEVRVYGTCDTVTKHTSIMEMDHYFWAEEE